MTDIDGVNNRIVGTRASGVDRPSGIGAAMSAREHDAALSHSAALDEENQ